MRQFYNGERDVSGCFADRNIIFPAARIHTDAFMHKPFTSLRKCRERCAKANLYIIRRRLYRTDIPRFAARRLSTLGRFNYSYTSAMQSTDTGNFRPSVVVNHAGVRNRLTEKLRM